MAQPASIRLFTALSVVSLALSIMLAGYAAQTTDFGFAIPADAAATLAFRIFAIRLAGCLLAIILIALVVFGRSCRARGALLARWILGFATSIAFLRGVGLLLPEGANNMLVAMSIAQLTIDGLAIASLYGEDAADWFGDSAGIRWNE